MLVILAIGGFPVAVVLSWMFDLITEGVERAEPRPSIRPEASQGPQINWFSRMGYVVGIFGISIAVWAVYFRVPDPAFITEPVASAMLALTGPDEIRRILGPVAT